FFGPVLAEPTAPLVVSDNEGVEGLLTNAAFSARALARSLSRCRLATAAVSVACVVVSESSAFGVVSSDGEGVCNTCGEELTGWPAATATLARLYQPAGIPITAILPSSTKPTALAINGFCFAMDSLSMNERSAGRCNSWASELGAGGSSIDSTSLFPGR